MGTAAAWRGRALCRPRGRQRGQALIYGVFVLLASLATLLFLFNTGQLVREKTKLVDTADAVAYSAGVLHARALNFEAYTNRAMVANSVVVAQMVSISAWNKMIWQEATTASMGSPSAGEVMWASGGPKLAVSPRHGLAYLGLTHPKTRLAYQLGVYEPLKPISEATAIAADQLIRKVLLPAEAAMRLSLLSNRSRLMTQVANANYAGAGSVKVDLLSGLTDQYVNYSAGDPVIHTYGGAQRERIAQVANTSAHRDNFVTLRRWTTNAIVPFDPNCAAVWERRIPELRRRGATELVNYDEWKAVDTYSLQRWKTKKKWGVVLGCNSFEKPIGWGGQVAAKGVASDAYDYGGAKGDTPSAFFRVNGFGGWFWGSIFGSSLASSKWSGYSGLPSFDDLSPAALGSDDPRVRFAVRVVRNESDVDTSSGNSPVKGGGTLLPKFSDALARNRMAAVATSEAYFQRPPGAPANSYGAGFGHPNEIGSLFNPYWDARLTTSSVADVAHARALQGD